MRGLSFDSVPGQRKPHPVRTGIITFVVVVLIVVIGVVKPNPFHDPLEVRATFAAGTGLHIYPNTPVRVDGIDVGFITQSDLNPRGGLDLTLEIENKEVVVHRDARAFLFYRTLLGRNVFVDLDPGTSGSPELGDAAIAADRTESQVEVDEVVRTLKPGPRGGIQEFLAQLDQGLDSDAPGVTVQRFGPALQNTGGAIEAARGQRPGYDLPRLVQGARAATAALNQDEAALAGLVDNGALALGVTATRRADLGSTVEQGPSTLTELRTTMTRLRETLDVLDPVATELRPGVRALAPTARQLTPTLRALTRFVPVALPTLRDLQPTLTSLASLSRTGVPLLRQLRPTLRRGADEILPDFNEVNADTGLNTFEAIGPTFATVSNSASTYDAGGFMQRFQPGLPSGNAIGQIVKGECQKYASGLPGSVQACEALLQASVLLLGGGNPAPGKATP